MAIFRELIDTPVRLEDESKWHNNLFVLLESAAKEDAAFLALHGIEIIISVEEKTVSFVLRDPSEDNQHKSVWVGPEYETGLLMLSCGGSGLIFDSSVNHAEALDEVARMVSKTFALPQRPGTAKVK